jgi:hypothetical protein
MSQDHSHLNNVVFTPKYRQKALFGQIPRRGLFRLASVLAERPRPDG